MSWITILPVGNIDEKILEVVANALTRILNGHRVKVSDYRLPAQLSSYNPIRRQYSSTKILAEISNYARRMRRPNNMENRFLGITDVDLYAEGFNYVFGEASYPEGVAVVSIHRLRPEFYGEMPNEKLLHERVIKESVHELGHTLGLKHCFDPSCVMYFSLHILMTDRKSQDFCERCRLKLLSM